MAKRSSTSSEYENQSDDFPSLSTVSSLDDDDSNRRPKKRKDGFHFIPYNDELIDYLKKKAQGIDEQEINEVDILEFEPHELPAFSAAKGEDWCWYFFCRLKKCGRGSRVGNSRKTRNGKWGVTGTTRFVKSKKTNQKIATKKTLTYHPDAHQKAKGKSEWSLHEYHLLPGFTNPENYVIVQLMKKGGKSVQLSPEKDSTVAAGYEDHSLGTAASCENSPSLGMMDNQAGFKASIRNYNLVPDQGLQMTGYDSDNSIDQSELADLEQCSKILEGIKNMDEFLDSIPPSQSPSSFEQTLQPSQGCVTSALSHHS